MSAAELVTVAIPALNEERSIGACLESVLAQTYDELEVLVLDGGSTDSTRAVIEAIGDPRVRIIDNPAKLPAPAMDEAFRAMKSDWLIRIDAHCTVPPTYVEGVMAHLSSGAWGGVGGRKDGVGRTAAGRAIAAVMGSPFGVGNSTYHHGTDVQTVDHIPFGAYPKAVIEAVGGWDRSMDWNEDFEFDFRVRQAGYELLFDPSLRIEWECRQSLRALWRQYRRYGVGKVDTLRRHPGSAAVRHLVAPALVLNVLGALVVGLVRPKWGLALLAPYTGVLVLGTVKVAPKVPAGSRPFVPGAMLAMHLSWGLGFWEGVAGRKRAHQNEN